MMQFRFSARALALGLLAGAASLYAGDAPEIRELPNFHQVNETLIRGARPKPGGMQRLAGLGIRTVIDLQSESGAENTESAAAQAAGLRYYNVPLPALGRPALADVEQVLALINDPANQPVFIHCKRGMDRTGTIIAAYRISHEGWSADRALAEAMQHDMGCWQFGMKKFIREFARMRFPAPPAAAPADPAAPSAAF